MKRDEYVEKFKAQVDEWNAEIAKWEARARSAQADVRADYERQLEAFRRQRDHAIERLRETEAASAEAWSDLMHGADEAWKQMRDAFEKARSHFQK
jgi:hypothetical protein